MDNVKRLICILLLLCFVLLVGCAPGPIYSIKQTLGLYPDTSYFPNTKWSCREIDLNIYMFDGETLMTGEYKVDSVSYRVIASFRFNSLKFEFYSSANISASNYSNSMVHCESNCCGEISTTYSFDKKNETFVCTTVNSKPVNNETIPETLNFENTGTIAQLPTVRWGAQEINMYLDSFSDTKDYFRGEIILEEKKLTVHALETGNNNYYMLTIENGVINSLRTSTTSPLIYMYFEIEDDQITAMVCDSYLSNTDFFHYWSYGDTIITFKPITSETLK